MPSIDDLDLSWGERAYVLVRPKEGTSWCDISRNSSERGMRDWRPAKISGFQDKEDRQFYGGRNDPRRIWVIGETGAYSIDDFEFGAVLIPEEIVSTSPECPIGTTAPAP